MLFGIIAAGTRARSSFGPSVAIGGRVKSSICAEGKKGPGLAGQSIAWGAMIGAWQSYPDESGGPFAGAKRSR